MSESGDYDPGRGRATTLLRLDMPMTIILIVATPMRCLRVKIGLTVFPIKW